MLLLILFLNNKNVDLINKINNKSVYIFFVNNIKIT